jgi:hypothetical protein
MKTFKKFLKYLFLTVFILFTILIIIGIYNDTEDLQFNREMEKRFSKLELSLNDTIFKMDNERFLKLSSSYEDSLNLYVRLSNEVEFSEQTKNIFNDLINSSRVKLEKKGIEIKKEEEERLKNEKEERLKKEEEERLKREKEMAWMEKYWHVGSWDYEFEGLYIRIDLRKNGTCDVYFVDGWIYDLTYKKTSTKIILSPIGNTNLEFTVDNKKRSIYTSGNATRMNRRIND